MLLFFLTGNNTETWETSSAFSPLPASEVDALGKKRYIGKLCFQ